MIMAELMECFGDLQDLLQPHKTHNIWLFIEIT